MGQSLVSRLPLEIVLCIGQLLPLKGRLALASTCSQVRGIFVPELFHTVRVTNKEEHSEAIKHVVGKFGRYIRGLHFVCYLYPEVVVDYHTGRVYGEEIPCCLPDAAARLLSGEILGQLRAVTIEYVPFENFGGFCWGEDEQDIDIHIHEEPEDEEATQRRETKFRWRKVIFQVWQALVANESVRYLEILQLPIRVSSMWSLPEWKTFLSRLQKLSICLWGGSDGACWQSNTTEGYLHFLSRLDEYFFEHCTNLWHLEIVANPNNPYGCAGYHHARLALHSVRMPMLRILELRNCIIDPNLIIFMKAHAKTLKRLVLVDCTSCLTDYLTDDKVSWADLFSEIHSSAPVLESLLITNSIVPLTRAEQFNEVEVENGLNYRGFVPHDGEPGNIKAIREAVSKHGRNLFSYTQIDDKYGFDNANEETIVARFEDGEDQHAYDKLLSLVSRNASTGTWHAQSHDAIRADRSRSWKTERISKRKHYDE